MPDAEEVTTARIDAWLAALGTSPEEVALTLHDRGVRGVMRSASGCPVAKYLKTMPGVAGMTVSTGDRGGSVYVPTPEGATTRIGFDLPAPVASFVKLFDMGVLGRDLYAAPYIERWGTLNAPGE